MNEWAGAAFLGFAAVAVMFGFAWMRGASPRRLVWQDLSRVRIPRGDERAAVESSLKLSLKVYVPVLIGSALVSLYLIIAEGEPLGLAVLICFGLPSLLAVIRAVRIMGFLRSL